MSNQELKEESSKLYKNAISNCEKAIAAIANNDFENKGGFIGELQDNVIDLNNSLDFNTGGKPARDLSSLYDYILYSSTQANIIIKTEPLEGCLSVLNTLYSGDNS